MLERYPGKIGPRITSSKNNRVVSLFVRVRGEVSAEALVGEHYVPK
jgi:hypothetical protein